MFVLHSWLKVFAIVQHGFDEETILFDIKVLPADNLSQEEYFWDEVSGLSLHARYSCAARETGSLVLHRLHLSVTRLLWVCHLNLNFEIII